ncbi:MULTISPECIES: hypothetical protein [unclassified Rhizobium]|nr:MULTISPECIES: hypothetical protein [unclassified Rhizobium]
MTGVHTGEAAGDTFNSIEAFIGSNLNDTFFASATADRPPAKVTMKSAFR